MSTTCTSNKRLLDDDDDDDTLIPRVKRATLDTTTTDSEEWLKYVSNHTETDDSETTAYIAALRIENPGMFKPRDLGEYYQYLEANGDTLSRNQFTLLLALLGAETNPGMIESLFVTLVTILVNDTPMGIEVERFGEEHLISELLGNLYDHPAFTEIREWFSKCDTAWRANFVKWTLENSPIYISMLLVGLIPLDHENLNNIIERLGDDWHNDGIAIWGDNKEFFKTSQSYLSQRSLDLLDRTFCLAENRLIPELYEMISTNNGNDPLLKWHYFEQEVVDAMQRYMLARYYNEPGGDDNDNDDET